MSRMPEKSKFGLWSRNTLGVLWIGAFIMALAGVFMPRPEFLYTLVLIGPLSHLALFTILSFVPMICYDCRQNAFLLSLSMAPLGYLLENLNVACTGESFNAVNALASNIGVLAGFTAGFIIRLIWHYGECRPTTESVNKPDNPPDGDVTQTIASHD